MAFRPDPPGAGWLALRTPRNAWSAQQLRLVQEAVRHHQTLPVVVKSFVAGSLDGTTTGRWRAALAALPTPPLEDTVGRFACASVLLRLAPLARERDGAMAAMIDRFLTAIAYRLPGSLWVRTEQELYLARLAVRNVSHAANEGARDALQILSARLLERALDMYKPGTTHDPDRWVSEILRNIRIDGQRRSNTEARIFDTVSPEDIPEQLLEQHGSAEHEVICAQIHEVVSQMGRLDSADPRMVALSRGLNDMFSQALATLSNNMLAVLYLGLLHEESRAGDSVRRDPPIASQLNTSVPNVRKRRHDAIKALQGALAGR
jgi:DNA-directed RNA polymerase specialized sigma24 family protein